MNYKSLFLLKATAISIALFLAHLAISANVANLGPFDKSLAVIPFVALMLATPIEPFISKIKLILFGLGVFLTVDLLLLFILANEGLIPLKLAAHSLYLLLPFLPFILWVIFAYRQVEPLWIPGKAPADPNTSFCPICGVKDQAMADHIRAVHTRG